MSLKLDFTAWCLVALCLVLIVFGRRGPRHSKTSAFLKAGRPLLAPRGALPLIGHLRLLPKDRPWIKLKEWADELGPIYRLKLGLENVVVVSDYATASALLDKRSAAYSSRPRLVYASEIVSRDQRLTFMPYNDLWRKERRYLNQLTSPAISATYEAWQDVESTRLLLDMLKRPKAFRTHAQRYAGSLIMQIAFNKNATVASDPNIHDMQSILTDLSNAAVPGRFIVDSLPFLNFLPAFLAPWKGTGRVLYERQKELFVKHLRDVRREMQQGKEANCFVQQMLSMKNSGLSEDQIAFLAGVMYGAGSDTTSIGIITFIMLMVNYPEAVKQAQAELDRVVGRERLPAFSDQADLPYVKALVTEVQRYRPIIAGGLPHATTEDDVYEGYFIPKGTTVIPNAWAIHQDPALYSQPERFMPERFIGEDGAFKGVPGVDRGHVGFGWGRRACPGAYIAERSLYIVFSRMLWAFDIRPATDQAGRAIPVNENAYSSGFSSHPQPFQCDITPRFEGVRKLVDLHAANVDV